MAVKPGSRLKLTSQAQPLETCWQLRTVTAPDRVPWLVSHLPAPAHSCRVLVADRCVLQPQRLLLSTGVQ
jgi:hypothetical protein